MVERWGRDEDVNPQDPTVPIEPDRTLASPRFDSGSRDRARAAVPLTEGERRRPLPLVPLALAAAMIGGGIGLAAFTYYQRHSAPPPSEQTTATPVGQTTPPPAATQDTRGVADATGDATQNAQPAAQPTQQAPQAPVTQPGAGDRAAQSGELRAALSEWVAATNARDIDRQMGLYVPRLEAYYLSRGASREAVRAEKRRVLAGAAAVDVRAAEPEIEIGPDGQTASMRFRKDYTIDAGGSSRRGAVLQELRWRRTPEGWRIVSERDLRVLQ
jgi:ketosteroid isomerase-like protein